MTVANCTVHKPAVLSSELTIPPFDMGTLIQLCTEMESYEKAQIDGTHFTFSDFAKNNTFLIQRIQSVYERERCILCIRENVIKSCDLPSAQEMRKKKHEELKDVLEDSRDELFRTAALEGHIECCREIHASGSISSKQINDAVIGAIDKGKIDWMTFVASIVDRVIGAEALGYAILCKKDVCAEVLLNESSCIDSDSIEHFINSCAAQGNAQFMKLLLKYYRGSDINKAIKRAILNGHADCVALLLASGFQVKIQELIGSAISAGQVECLEVLLSRGIDTNINNSVFLAIDVNKPECFKELLFYTTISMGELLFYAAKKGSPSIVRLILKESRSNGITKEEKISAIKRAIDHPRCIAEIAAASEDLSAKEVSQAEEEELNVLVEQARAGLAESFKKIDELKLEIERRAKRGWLC